MWSGHGHHQNQHLDLSGMLAPGPEGVLGLACRRLGSRGCVSGPTEGSSGLWEAGHCNELSWSRFYGHACSSVLGGLRRRIWSLMPSYSVVYEGETLSWEGKEKTAWFDKDRRIEANLGWGLERDLFWFFFSFELGSHSIALTQAGHGVQPPECFNGRCEPSYWAEILIPHVPQHGWLVEARRSGCVYAQAFGCTFMIHAL